MRGGEQRSRGERSSRPRSGGDSGSDFPETGEGCWDVAVIMRKGLGLRRHLLLPSRTMLAWVNGWFLVFLALVLSVQACGLVGLCGFARKMALLLSSPAQTRKGQRTRHG